MSCCRGCIAPKRQVGCRTTCPAWQKEEGDKEARYARIAANTAGTRPYIPDKAWERKAWTKPMALKHT